MHNRAFTLIELLISIAIATIIAGAIYFSLNTALESWGYSSDQLALQKVLNDVMDEITDGIIVSYGLKDGLEITQAGSDRVEFVPPWIDDTHTAVDRGFVYTLNRKIKPGTALAIAEFKLPESEEYRLTMITRVEEKESPRSRIKLGQVLPSGSQLRFIYHPDPKTNPDVIKSIWWDREDGQIYSQYVDEIKDISKNPFDIKITKVEFRYYDNANNLVTDSDWVDTEDITLITGIEVYMTAELGQYTKSLISFVSLRNAPMRSGYIPIRKGMRISIPDSHNVHTFLLSNISGVDNEDILQLEAIPESGKSWRIKITFSRIGTYEPKIEKYTIEYPRGHTLYTAYPKTGVDAGLNLLALDSNGFYDYDDDEDTDDVVMLEGDVTLEVKLMDVEGTGLFVRP